MVDNAWGNRHNFLKGGHPSSAMTLGQKVLSALDGLLDKLGKMDAVRPSEPVSTAYTIVSACTNAVRQAISSPNSTSLVNNAAVSDHTETGRRPSLS